LTDRYYPAFLDFKHAGQKAFLVTNENEGKTHIISFFEGNLFNALSGCRSIDSHIQSILESDKYIIEKPVLADIMRKWVNEGFLRNEKLLLKKSAENNKVKRRYKTSRIISGCITSNRPDMLNKWLESRAGSTDYVEKKTPIIICDDTSNNEIIRKNKITAEHYRKNYPGKIFYIDDKQKLILIKMIKKMLPAQVPERIMDFSLSINNSFSARKTPGTNRNALLLICAGHDLYTSDDDIEYSFYLKSAENKNCYFPDEKILSPRFYPDMNTLKNNFKKTENIHLLDIFENLMNMNIVELVDNRHPVDFINITPRTAMLQEKGLLGIRTVSAGYIGGRWYQNPYRPLIQQNKERDDFFYNSQKYMEIKNNGLNIMSADKNTLVVGDTLMGGTLCIDNKNLLPPCFPQGMRDDTCFSILLNNCLKPCLSLHLPVALYHNPDEKPPFSFENFQNVSIDMGVYSILVLEKLSSSFIYPPGRERLTELGFYFQQFGKLKASDFEEQLKLMQLGFLTKAMNHNSYLLDLYEREPVWWAEDMERYYELLKKEALGKNTVVPRELRIYETKEEALKVFKNYIYKCGEMLQWWPEIWEAARVINMEGRGLIDI